MINIEIEYFSLNRILLLTLGLWPYKQSNFTRFQFILLSSILTTYVIFQYTIFISHRCTLTLIIKVLPSVFVFTLFVINYDMFYVNIKIMKNLLEQLLHTCNELSDENEIAIINEYGCNGKHYTVALTVLTICSTFTVIIASFWSDIFNMISPTNASRSHHLLIITEYFIDQEKYFYLIQFHFIASWCIGIIVTLAVGTMLITYLQYTCGMFKIASYRIEHSININTLQNINQKDILILKGLICAVDIHRQAMRLSKHLLSSFEMMMFCLIALGVASVSLNLFRIFQVLSSKENIKELVMPLLYVTAAVLYMFLANYIGQTIINHNHHVFVTAYNVRWYIAPLYIQRTILFLLQRNTRNFTLNIGGLFVASIEGFATLYILHDEIIII
ncbi:uncharacterized protein LOC109610502 isoform X2 [Camponotus floridanus]|uniref:uncharacterized protein LOC109610502 isoform X2 n=1 Tax=Camponotus floridanus TaxID=104421 RepID=UPI000DC6C947|nr:uncharacterized protein LOC109610502 isoform X2 [Camponotus floridanus]